MPPKVPARRALAKPRMMRLPPAEPNGSLLVKLTPGSWLITSLIDWPGTWRWMNSELRTSRLLVVGGISTPPTPLVRVPVTTISFSISTVPVDCAKAAAGATTTAAAHSNVYFLIVFNPSALGVADALPQKQHTSITRPRGLAG